MENKLENCVLIMTPLPLEFKAVARHIMGERKTIVKDQTAYECGIFQGKHHRYNVVLCEPGMRNVDMALATERAIQSFKPQLVLLIGIAGGIKDLKKGDVAVASSAFNYDSGKELENQFLPRPTEFHFSKDLLAHAQALSRSQDWKQRSSDGAPEANVLIGPVATGDKVVAAAHNNPTFERIAQYLSHCKFLEMEAGGFGNALQAHRDIHGLVIRGISDMCGGKAETDGEGWQEVAAERAAAVGFQLLNEMDCSSFIITLMDSKTLAKAIYDLLFPLPESIKEIGNDFATATNNEVREIWKRVKPLFIKEVEELQKAPTDGDAQADVRNKLKRELEADTDLKAILAGMVEKAKPIQEGVSVVGSKNVVVGDFKVGGDFRVGDETTTYHGSKEQVGRDKVQINHYYGSERQELVVKEQDVKSLPISIKEHLHSLISKGRPEQALDDLCQYTKGHSGPFQQEVILLSDKWQALARKNRIGTISYENAILERSTIVSSLLEIITEVG